MKKIIFLFVVTFLVSCSKYKTGEVILIEQKDTARVISIQDFEGCMTVSYKDKMGVYREVKLNVNSISKIK